MPRDLEQEMLRAVAERVTKLRDDVRENISRTGKRASGRTQASLRVEVDGDHIILYGRAFFATLENGSAPWGKSKTGVSCSFKEFKEIIRQWATDKGLHEIARNESALYLVTRKIVREGSLDYNKEVKDDVYTTLVTDALADIGTNTTALLSTAINDSILKWSKNRRI